MGIYLNPGKEAFEEAVRSIVFVDKTEMIRYLNSVLRSRQKYLSVSRPRRFGKTTAVDMICAYYGRGADSRGIFEKTKLAKSLPEQGSDPDEPWDEHLGKYDVIRIVMTDFIKAKEPVGTSLARLRNRILKDFEREYPETEYDPNDLGYSLDEFYYRSKTPMIIVIDEWDAIFRIRRDDTGGQTEYLNFLRDWMKDKPYIAMAYMTGILPIKKYGEHSALNMFDEYSMISPKSLAQYTGFTSEEVKELCRERNLKFEPVKEWYDGYLLTDKPSEEILTADEDAASYNRYEIYSPLSVVNAVRFKRLENYWNMTETYEALAEYIRRDYDGLKETVALLMSGGKIRVDITGYQNDMTTFHNKDDILTLLIHLGYLGYDEDSGEVFIPNKEILDVFRTSTRSGEWDNAFKLFEISRELLKATWAMDEEKVAYLVEKAHDRTANKTYNSEAALSYGIQLAYYAAEEYYTKALELDSGKGYADIVYLPSPRYPDKPALLIELKYDKTADTALEQIRRREYPDRLEHYKGNILLIAINYDRDISNKESGFKHHSCIIERA